MLIILFSLAALTGTLLLVGMVRRRPRQVRVGIGPGRLAAAMGMVVVVASCAVPPPASNAERVPLVWPRTAAPSHKNVSYGPDTFNTADIYSAVGGTNRGVIVLVHGGAFVGGNRDEAKNFSGVVMSQTHRGFAVVNISYRLTTATKNHFPAAVNDVSMAVNWVRRNGDIYGLNPRTVIVAGHSAGATVASLVGVGWNSPILGALGRTAKVDGYISFAGVMDFNKAIPQTKAMGRMWLGPRANTAGWLGAASPTTHLDRNDPPGYLAQGDWDSLVESAQLDHMLGALLNSGAPYTKLFYDRVTTGEMACRWHLPQCGVNAKELNKWIDLVDQRKI